MQLEGKRTLITGAGSGIGRALALEGARRGMLLALAGRRMEPLQETLQQLPGSGHFIVLTDVTDAASRRALATTLANVWGGLDILVNNAGVVPGGPLERLSDAELEAAMATNLMAPVAMVRDLLGLLRQSDEACVVNIGSLLGEVPYPLFAAYSASKAGLAGFSEALRRELAPLGIGVVHVAPRATRTAAAKPFETLAEPFGMTFDTPEQVAHAIWKAVRRKRLRLLPGRAERLFVRLHQLFPRLVDRFIARQLARAASPSLAMQKAGHAVIGHSHSLHHPHNTHEGDMP